MEYIRRLETYIAKLESELEAERLKSGEYLDKWIAAQDLAAFRNLQLLTK